MWYMGRIGMLESANTSRDGVCAWTTDLTSGRAL